ncbi:hypothetical protein Tco_1495476, partial [Tanacetum coccineum]
AAADAKYYRNIETYNILKARDAKVPKTRKTPMSVANPREVPEYELNPLELQIRKSDGISKGNYQVAKWNGTKVSVKILDKDSYSDPESICSKMGGLGNGSKQESFVSKALDPLSPTK